MDQMEQYVETARHRAREEREQLRQRHEQGWQLARTAATLLKDEFSAGQVVLLSRKYLHAGTIW